MLRPKYLMVQRDHLSRGVYIVSEHRFRLLAMWAARREERTYQKQIEQAGGPWRSVLTKRFTWEVRQRCA